MTRIFLSLALLSLAAYAANFVTGLATGEHQAAAEALKKEYRAFHDLERSRAASKTEIKAGREKLSAAKAAFEPYRRWINFHRLLGVAAGLLVILVNSITITYFVGTSRWVKEVVDAYRLDENLAEESRVIKRKSFPWSVFGMLVIVAIVALGAASDPSGWTASNAVKFVSPHYLAAIIGLIFIAFAYWMQWTRIAENYAVIERIMGLVAERQQALAAAKAEAGA